MAGRHATAPGAALEALVCVRAACALRLHTQTYKDHMQEFFAKARQEGREPDWGGKQYGLEPEHLGRSRDVRAMACMIPPLSVGGLGDQPGDPLRGRAMHVRDHHATSGRGLATWRWCGAGRCSTCSTRSSRALRRAASPRWAG